VNYFFYYPTLFHAIAVTVINSITYTPIYAIMKKIKTHILLPALLMLICMIEPVISRAQLPSDPGCDPLDPACPIDGGVYLLIAAAISIAAIKAYKLKQAPMK
jgi:hypothetical protein